MLQRIMVFSYKKGKTKIQKEKVSTEHISKTRLTDYIWILIKLNR